MSLSRIVTPLLIAVTSIFCLPSGASASVIAHSDMALSNMRFSLSDSSAQLVWTDVWYGTVQAQAQDTSSGSDSDNDSLLGNSGSITATANTAHVTSSAHYTPTSATTQSDLSLPDYHSQGDGSAVSTLDNYFMITGGSPLDTLDVTIEFDYFGTLFARAGPSDFFSIALAALLNLQDLSGNSLGSDFINEMESGSGTSFGPLSYAGTLAINTTLSYGTEYWLYAEADSEVYGYAVPLPGAIIFMLSGIVALLSLSRQKSRLHTKQ